MLVGSRMTPNPIMIAPDISIADAMEMMKQKNVHRFPVVDKKGKLIGIVTYQDLLHASPSPATALNMWEISYLLNRITVKEVMKWPVITVAEDTAIEEAARLMVEKKIGALPVLRDGAVIGIITESDLFKVFLELFGARERGIRLTLLAPYVKGSMAQITSAITAKGGLILAFETFSGDDPSNWGCTVKVADLSREELLAVVKPLVVEIVDIREASGLADSTLHL